MQGLKLNHLVKGATGIDSKGITASAQVISKLSWMNYYEMKNNTILRNKRLVDHFVQARCSENSVN